MPKVTGSCAQGRGACPAGALQAHAQRDTEGWAQNAKWVKGHLVLSHTASPLHKLLTQPSARHSYNGGLWRPEPPATRKRPPVTLYVCVSVCYIKMAPV